MGNGSSAAAGPKNVRWSKVEASGDTPPGGRGYTAVPMGPIVYLIKPGSVYTFDTTSMCWAAVRCSGDVPCARSFAAVAAVGTMIYVFGGSDGEDVALNDMHQLNTRTLVWRKLEVAGWLPDARYEHTMAAVGKRLFLFGGGNSSGWLNDVAVFDTVLCRWSAPPVGGFRPLSRLSHAMVVVNGKLVVFGGFTKKKNRVNDLHVLHPSPKEMLWAQPQLQGWTPPACAAHSLVALGDIVLCFGGYNNTGRRNGEAYVLDVPSRTWCKPTLQGTARPVPRSYHAACAVGRRLFVFFGTSGPEDLNDVWALDMEYVAGAMKPAEVPASSFLADLGSMVNSATLSDVQFVLGDSSEPVYGHRALLAHRSPHFRAMLTAGLAESRQEVIRLPDITRSSFLVLLQFLYTDVADLTADNAAELLVVADRYGELRLKALCEAQLAQSVSNATVCDLYGMADMYGAHHLAAVCLNAVVLSHLEVCASPAYERLPQHIRDTVQEVLQANRKIFL